MKGRLEPIKTGVVDQSDRCRQEVEEGQELSDQQRWRL